LIVFRFLGFLLPFRFMPPWEPLVPGITVLHYRQKNDVDKKYTDEGQPNHAVRVFLTCFHKSASAFLAPPLPEAKLLALASPQLVGVCPGRDPELKYAP
jgi:hypothetical protein